MIAANDGVAGDAANDGVAGDAANDGVAGDAANDGVAGDFTNDGVKRESHWLSMDDGAEIYVRVWESDAGSAAGDSTSAAGELTSAAGEGFAPNGDPLERQAPRAILQLAHGMAEHIHRYDEFAAYVAERGIHVVGNDHRGHGRTGYKAGVRGYFADTNGFDRVTDDVRAITAWIAARYPGAPIFLMGHSMGSMLVRRYIQRYADAVNGGVIMGTTGDPGFVVTLGRWLARLEMWRKGARQPSPLLQRMSSGSYNKRVRAPKTPFDWLSRDAAEVAKYVADPLCGFIPSAGFYYDLFTGVKLIHNDALIRQIPKQLPMLFVSGDADPVGDYGAGVRQAIRQYRRHGLQRIESIMYEGGRHEPLNDTNKDEVYKAIYEWLEARLDELAPGNRRQFGQWIDDSESKGC